MIKSIRVVNPSKEMLDLDLETSHIDTGIYIKSITGIGPEKASINTTALAMEDGGVFNSARADVRNIVLTLGFYESPTLHNSIEDSRHLTYKFFPKKKQITLEFYTDNRDSFIQGYVESNEPDIFSKEESTQISIICPDPNFYDIDEFNTKFGGINALFEFPFESDTVGNVLSFIGGMDPDDVIFSETDPPIETGSKLGQTCYCRTSDPRIFNEYIWSGIRWYLIHEGLYINTADLIIANITEGVINQVLYDGDADTGVLLTVHFVDRATNIIVSNVDYNEQIKFDTDKIESIIGSEIISGDDIILDTRPGQKSCIFRRSGNSTDIFNAIGREYFDKCWFKLRKGINPFVFRAETGFENVKIDIEAYRAYDGV